MIPCPQCGVNFCPNGWNTKPHAVCISCFRLRRNPRRQKGQAVSSASYDQSESIQVISQISVISLPDQLMRGITEPCTIQTQEPAPEPMKKFPPIKLDHHIFSSGEWRSSRFLQHPAMPLSLSVRKEDYKSFKVSCPKVSGVAITAKLDSCAQSCLWSLRAFFQAGFKKEDLIPVSLSMSAANKSHIRIVGALIVRLSGISKQGENISCSTMVYVSPSADGFYLSLEAMIDLGVINRSSQSFPTELQQGIGSTNSSVSMKNEHIVNVNCGKDLHAESKCSCPRRVEVPGRPDALPFVPQAENNEAMREWLLQTFSGSTFNTCPHQDLPCMLGAEIQIHIEKGVHPKACHTPVHIPIHWQEQVHADLLRDEALGVIERVPYGEPVDWCHRMVISRKHDGSPRRTVDLSPLNRYCKRETYSSESPFQITRRVPGNTWKTVTDAWNGFHGMVLREEDRPLTTFITPHGRWRYKRAPQGFVSSGDGYNRRYTPLPQSLP